MSGWHSPPRGGYEYPSPPKPQSGFDPFRPQRPPPPVPATLYQPEEGQFHHIPTVIDPSLLNQPPVAPPNTYGPPPDQVRFETIMGSTGHTAPAPQFHENITPLMPLAERAEILAHYVDDGPRRVNELDMDYRLRLERAKENMGIEHREMERPVWVGYPLEMTEDLRLQWHKDASEKWEEHKRRIKPGPQYDRNYHNAFLAEKAARQARNSAKRAQALERKRQLDDQNGNPWLNTPEAPDDSGDELWDWGFNGALEEGWDPTAEYSNMVSAVNPSERTATKPSQTKKLPTRTQPQRKESSRTSGFGTRSLSQGLLDLPRSGASISSSSLPPPGRPRRGRSGRDPPNAPAPRTLPDDAKYSTVRCNNCAKRRKLCRIKDSGVPCSECVQNGQANSCHWERLINNSLPSFDQPTKNPAPEKKQGQRCILCAKRKKKCDYDLNGPPCSLCVRCKKADECRVDMEENRKFWPRNKVSRRVVGRRELSAPRGRSASPKPDPCDNCKRHFRECDRERPCSACVTAGQYDTCEASRQDQVFQVNPQGSPQIRDMANSLGMGRGRERGSVRGRGRRIGRGRAVRMEMNDEDVDEDTDDDHADPIEFDVPSWAQPQVPQPLAPQTPTPQPASPPQPGTPPAAENQRPFTGTTISPLRTLICSQDSPASASSSSAELQPQRKVRQAIQQATRRSARQSTRQRANQELQAASSSWQARGQELHPDNEDDEMLDFAGNDYDPFEHQSMGYINENPYNPDGDTDLSSFLPEPEPLLRPAPPPPLPDFDINTAGGAEALPSNPVLEGILVPANRDWKGVSEFFGKPGCHEWEEWFRRQRAGTRCNQLPSNSCMVFDHAEWCTCVYCHGEQNVYYRGDENATIESAKAYFCFFCAEDTKVEKRDNGAESKTQVGICLCSGQLKKSWLCHEHRKQAIELVKRKVLLAEDWVMRRRFESGTPCARCVDRDPDPNSGAWTCVACREDVVEII